MKKFFALFLLSISLVFTSCSSLFDGQLQRGNRVVIKIPGKETKNAARNIYGDNPNVTLEEYDEASFTVRLIHENGKILSKSVIGSGIVIFENVTPGNWQADCTVSIKGKEDFAFAISKFYEIKKGVEIKIPLTLSFNTIESIDKIEISKNYKPLEYDLGDEINKNNLNLDFDVTLKNGYTRTYSVQEMEAANIINNETYGFVEADVSDPDNVVPVMNGDTSEFAKKFYYFIRFGFTNDSWPESKYTAVPVILNAKKPVIIKQPSSTLYKTVVLEDERTSELGYSFDVVVDDFSENYGNINYEWKIRGDIQIPNNHGDNSYLGPNYKDYNPGFYNNPGSIYQHYFYCTITNVDNEGGLNGETTRSVDTINATLIEYNPQKNDHATNHNFLIENATDVSLFQTEPFIYDGESLPDPSLFRVEEIWNVYKPGTAANVSSKYTLYFYDMDSFNIEFKRMEGTTNIPDYDKSVGCVPYLVNFEYQYYPIDTDKTTASLVCFQKNPVTQKIENRIIWVETKLGKIPDFEYNLIQSSPGQRYYNKQEQKWYRDKDSWSELYDGPSYEIYVPNKGSYNYCTNSVWGDIPNLQCVRYYSDENHTKANIDLFEATDYISAIKDNSGVTLYTEKINLIKEDTGIFGYSLSDDVKSILENGTEFTVQLGVEITPKTTDGNLPWLDMSKLKKEVKTYEEVIYGLCN